MTSLEALDIFKSETGFFASLSDVQEAILYGSALKEIELTGDVDLLLVPSREMSEGEKIDLRQQVWDRFKGKLPVMLEVRTPDVGLSKETFEAKGVAMETVYRR